jgi:DNA-binding MarR family transcriptional regulator
VNTGPASRPIALGETDTPESPTEASITVNLLAAVEESSVITQRSLSRQLGIALGLTNAYLKRCINKGLIKISTAPANRYRYYLTPKGFAEKSRLTANYLAYSFDFLRRARADYEVLFEHCEAEGWRQVVLAGAGELADIALLGLAGRDMAVLGLLATAGETTYHRLRVAPELAAFGQCDAAILTDHRTPQKTFDRLIKELPPSRVLAPRLLNVSRQAPRFAE